MRITRPNASLNVGLLSLAATASAHRRPARDLQLEAALTTTRDTDPMLEGENSMNLRGFLFSATAALVLALSVADARPAAALAAKPCGGVAGPTAHASGMTFSRYSVVAAGIDCGFAKETVRELLRQRLPNSLTPVRAKAPAGWICVAQEVDTHVPATGHCQQGRKKALAWVPYGIHR